MPTEQAMSITRPLLLAGLMLVLSCSVSVATTVFTMGRAIPQDATKEWVAVLVATSAVMTAWQVVYLRRLSTTGTRRMTCSLTAALVLTGLVLVFPLVTSVGVYVSDEFHHAYTNDPFIRLTAVEAMVVYLYVVFVLEEAILGWARSDRTVLRCLLERLQRSHEPITIATTLVIGACIGSSYVTVVGDDYARYWTIADALQEGLGYPVSHVEQGYSAGGMAAYLIDLPGLPLAMLASFALLGHSALAAMMPALLAASCFTALAYLACKRLTHQLPLSYTAAVVLSTFPLLSFYVLRAAEPDGMFTALLMALAYLAVRCTDDARSYPAWAALGVVAGLTALTRPEGIMYGAMSLLSIAIWFRSNRGLHLALTIFASMLLAFSATMLANIGVVWPNSFNGTVGVQHVLANLDGFTYWGFPRYAEALGSTEHILVCVGITLTVLYIVGTLELFRKRPYLVFLALLPVANLVSFLLVSPALTGRSFRTTIFGAHHMDFLMQCWSFLMQ